MRLLQHMVDKYWLQPPAGLELGAMLRYDLLISNICPQTLTATRSLIRLLISQLDAKNYDTDATSLSICRLLEAG